MAWLSGETAALAPEFFDDEREFAVKWAVSGNLARKMCGATVRAHCALRHFFREARASAFTHASTDRTARQATFLARAGGYSIGGTKPRYGRDAALRPSQFFL
jgi:hypothetical protein